MTTGALMFAFNNEGIDYVKMAAWNAQNIRRHLGIPVAVITDDPGQHRCAFDQVIIAQPQGTDTRYFQDLDQTVTWHNAGRPDACDLTPWDRTLLLDTDYVINSNALQDMLSSQPDIVAFDYACDVTGFDKFDDLNHFGEHGIPMWWATVIIFNRDSVARYVFDVMKMVRSNWQHYRDLYGIQHRTYRNDYAFTIALGIINGHTDSVMSIPWNLETITPQHRLTESKYGQYYLEFTDAHNTKFYISLKDMDFHVMGKQHLMDIINAAD
jgi:hypothetical protein